RWRKCNTAKLFGTSAPVHRYIPPFTTSALIHSGPIRTQPSVCVGARSPTLEGSMMRALIVALSLVPFATSAIAADMPLKAAPRPAAPVYNWTGCYLGAGGGYGMFNQDNTFVTDPIFGPSIVDSGRVTGGGRGWFGTVGGGCDYQISERWVIGAFADY